MGDGVRVPAFREHGDRDHTADRAAELARLPDRVHHFAQKILVGQAAGLHKVSGAVHLLAPETLDFVRRGDPEGLVQAFSRLKLSAVDEQGAGPRQRVAVDVEVPEQLEPPVLELRAAVLTLPVVAGDVVVEQLRGRGVVADHDEARGTLDVRLAPGLEHFLVVAVERV